MFDITSDSALGAPVSGRNCKTKPNKVSTQVSREKNHTEAVKQNKTKVLQRAVFVRTSSTYHGVWTQEGGG